MFACANILWRTLPIVQTFRLRFDDDGLAVKGLSFLHSHRFLLSACVFALPGKDLFRFRSHRPAFPGAAAVKDDVINEHFDTYVLTFAQLAVCLRTFGHWGEWKRSTVRPGRPFFPFFQLSDSDCNLNKCVIMFALAGDLVNPNDWWIIYLGSEGDLCSGIVLVRHTIFNTYLPKFK